MGLVGLKDTVHANPFVSNTMDSAKEALNRCPDLIDCICKQAPYLICLSYCSLNYVFLRLSRVLLVARGLFRCGAGALAVVWAWQRWRLRLAAPRQVGS